MCRYSQCNAFGVDLTRSAPHRGTRPRRSSAGRCEAKRDGTEKLPETYLVVGGEVVKKFVGQTDWDNPELRALIASRLSGDGAQTGSGSKSSGI